MPLPLAPLVGAKFCHDPPVRTAAAGSTTAEAPRTVKKSRRGPRSPSSQYRGATFYWRTGRWESHIWDCGKPLYLAARAYDRAAIKFRGVGANINFCLEDYTDDMKHGIRLWGTTKSCLTRVVGNCLEDYTDGIFEQTLNIYWCGKSMCNYESRQE